MSIQIGQIVKLVTCVGAIIAGVRVPVKKLYDTLKKIIDMKTTYDEYEKTVDKHDAVLKEFAEKFDAMQKVFDEIVDRLDVQEDTDMKRLRHDIVMCGENYLESGYASIRQWSSLMEMYSLYKETYHGNSYVDSLIKRCEANVSIVGRLDEHGNDIEMK